MRRRKICKKSKKEDGKGEKRAKHASNDIINILSNIQYNYYFYKIVHYQKNRPIYSNRLFHLCFMLKYYNNTLRFIRSKIGLKIGLLVFIQIFFIIISLVILSYYQSQMTYLGNSINIAGKNRFLTSNLMFSTADYFLGNNSDISNINAAINELEANILILKNGGKISDIVLKPLPSEFSNDWNSIYQKWILLKTTLVSNNLLKETQIITNPSTVAEVSSRTVQASSSSSDINKTIKTILETGALPLINSSNVLVSKLGEHAKNSSQYSIFLQILFAILNIGVTAIFIFTL